MLPTALLATLATPLATVVLGVVLATLATPLATVVLGVVLATLVAALMVQAVQNHSTTTSEHPLRVAAPPQHHTCLMDHFAMVHRSSPSATRQRDVH
jgi:uncharacterized membrane protein YdbT with pleckstrin-like domain